LLFEHSELLGDDFDLLGLEGDGGQRAPPRWAKAGAAETIKPARKRLGNFMVMERWLVLNRR
jgi:hypothetical protein